MIESLLLNGEPLRIVDPGLLRASSYGQFTSMQVRAGTVDGLDLHFERLDRSAREVFGQPLAAERVRADLRAALDHAGSSDLSLRVNVFSTTELQRLTDLSSYDAAYLTNSIDPALPVASITVAGETTSYAPHPPSADRIAAAYASVPVHSI